MKCSGVKIKVGAIGTLNNRSRSIVGLAWGGEPNPGVMDYLNERKGYHLDTPSRPTANSSDS